MNGHLARVAPGLARWPFGGRSLVFRPALSGSFLATSFRPPAAPFGVLEPGVGCSRCRCRVRRSRKPLRFVRRSSSLHCGAPSLRCGMGGRAAPLVRLRRFVFEDAHPRLRFSLFRGGWRSFGRSIVTGVPDRKSAAAGGSRDASASGMEPCCGVPSLLRRCGSAPPRASLRATPPAFAAAPRPGLRHRLRSSARASGPRTVAARRERASGGRSLRAERVGSRCRLRALMASSAVLVTPGASALLRRLCSLVAPAGTLDAAPSGGWGRDRFCVRKIRLATAWRNRVRPMAKPSLTAGPWVPGVVGWGKPGSGVVRPRGVALAA